MPLMEAIHTQLIFIQVALLPQFQDIIGYYEFARALVYTLVALLSDLSDLSDLVSAGLSHSLLSVFYY